MLGGEIGRAVRVQAPTKFYAKGHCPTKFTAAGALLSHEALWSSQVHTG